MMNGYIFVPIAERETWFYLDIADVIKKKDPQAKVVFCSLFQPTDSEITKRGYQVLSIYETVPRDYAPVTVEQIHKAEKDFGIPNLHKLILHEKLTFGVSDDGVLYAKFVGYLRAIDQQLAKLISDHRDTKFNIVQELGGFIGPLSYFYAAQKNGLNNFFTEPAFYKGRIHFNKNSLDSCLKLNTATELKSLGPVRDYLREATQQKVVVAAQKDRHHYLDMGFKKIFNPQNFTKFSKKLWFKFVKDYRQEYEHIFNHTLRSLRMLVARKLNASLYFCDKSRLQENTYLYFPFHVQLDYALTVRSPEYLDQLGLVEKILQILPAGVKLAVKEHPASVGGLDRYRLQRILGNSKCLFLHPSFNSYDVIAGAKAVITINSKVGAEALTLGKQVFAFGRCFYSESGLVKRFSNWTDFEAFLLSAASSSGDQNAKNVKSVEESAKAFAGEATDLEKFFMKVWDQSYPNELYNREASNVENFALGLITEATRN